MLYDEMGLFFAEGFGKKSMPIFELCGLRPNKEN